MIIYIRIYYIIILMIVLCSGVSSAVKKINDDLFPVLLAAFCSFVLRLARSHYI